MVILIGNQKGGAGEKYPCNALCKLSIASEKENGNCIGYGLSKIFAFAV